MGSTYSNLTLRGADHDRIVAALKSRGRDAYVGPTENGSVVVFDEASEGNPPAVAKLAAELTGDLGCSALAVTVYDDDILLLGLARAGKVLDEYDSCPDYSTGGGAPPVGGNAALLCDAFGVPAARGRVEEILRGASGKGACAGASERHDALAEALGIPRHAVSLGYGYVRQGEAGALEGKLTRVGAPGMGDGNPRAAGPGLLARLRAEVAAELKPMLAGMKAAPHGYFRALATGDVAALRALFAGEPVLDDPLSGRLIGEAALATHFEAFRGYLADALAHYAPAELLETWERVVTTGNLMARSSDRSISLAVACVWDRKKTGELAACRAYYRIGALTGVRGERGPVLQPAVGAALPDVVARHLRALAEDDGNALVGTYNEDCISHMGFAVDLQRVVRSHYGGTPGQGGETVLQPCTVTSNRTHCAMEYVTTRWQGRDVPAQAGLAFYTLRDGRICQVQLFADLAPTPADLHAAIGFPVMPDVGKRGKAAKPATLAEASRGSERVQKLMRNVQDLLNPPPTEPGGASAPEASSGKPDEPGAAPDGEGQPR